MAYNKEWRMATQKSNETRTLTFHIEPIARQNNSKWQYISHRYIERMSENANIEPFATYIHGFTRNETTL